MNERQQLLADILAKQNAEPIAEFDTKRAMNALNRGTVAGTLGGPVDLATALLRPLGYETEKPFMGTEWFQDKMNATGVTDPNYSDPAGETVASFADPVSGLGKLAALAGKLPLMAAHTVYHGSPHSFNKFDASKIGTGEGAQAFGHGIYVAENPSVAKSYENSAGLYRHKQTGEVIDSRNIPMDKMATFAGDYEPAGNSYKADIPDEWLPKMLDWDKPLNQQGEEVQKALGEAIKNLDPKFVTINPEKSSGAYIYKNLGIDLDGEHKAAEHLNSLGIPGIRYLDNSSRTTGQGTSNYVIFPGNEGKVKILERNNKPIE